MRLLMRISAGFTVIAGLFFAVPALASGSLDGTYQMLTTDTGCSTPLPPTPSTFSVVNNVLGPGTSYATSINNGRAEYSYSGPGVSFTGYITFSPTSNGVNIDGSGSVSVNTSATSFNCSWHSTGERVSGGSGPPPTSGGSAPPTSPSTAPSPSVVLPPVVIPSADPAFPPRVARVALPPAPPMAPPGQDDTCHVVEPPGTTAIHICVPSWFSASATPGAQVRSSTGVTDLSSGTLGAGDFLDTGNSMATVAIPDSNSSITLGPGSAWAVYTALTDNLLTNPAKLSEIVCPNHPGNCLEASAIGMEATAAKALIQATSGRPYAAMGTFRSGVAALTNGALSAVGTAAMILSSAQGLVVPDGTSDPVMVVSAQPAGSWFYDYVGRYHVINRASGSSVLLSPGESVFVPSSAAAAASVNLVATTKHFNEAAAPRWWVPKSALPVWLLPAIAIAAAYIVLNVALFFLTRKRRARKRAAKRARQEARQAARQAKRGKVAPPAATVPETAS